MFELSVSIIVVYVLEKLLSNLLYELEYNLLKLVVLFIKEYWIGVPLFDNIFTSGCLAFQIFFNLCKKKTSRLNK